MATKKEHIQKEKPNVLSGRTIWPLTWSPDTRPRPIIAQDALGLTADEILARKSILCDKARIWIVNEANQERLKSNWTDEEYLYFKNEIRIEDPTPLRDLKEGERSISTRCERGGYTHNYVLKDGWITGFSNHSST